uniref:Uncharacterized protein n=1 Tax=Knipowitschia caucasica TaxID=637954 RepID=A0AAV2MKS5_KNICA
MSVNLESQLLSVMNVLVKAAVSEIGQLFSESCAELRLHLTQSLRENDGLRTRMRLMRSEMFSLKLQNRAARPSSRCGPVRVNTPKPRSKVQPKPADSTPAVSQDQSIPVSEKSAIDECPDIILIKDEDDEMTASGHSFHNDKPGNTKGEEQKAANSQAQEAFITQSDFYNTSDPLAFSIPGMPTALTQKLRRRGKQNALNGIAFRVLRAICNTLLGSSLWIHLFLGWVLLSPSAHEQLKLWVLVP